VSESNPPHSYLSILFSPRCDDFFEFACGNFQKETVIPDDKTQVTSFSVIDNKLMEDLRIIIQEPINDTEIEPFQNLKRLYQACINETLINSRGNTDLSSLLAQWPVAGGNIDAAWTWQKSAADARNAGYSASNFLSFSVSSDNRDSTKRVIRVS
jgi:neprilysin